MMDVYKFMRPYFDIDFFATPDHELVAPTESSTPAYYISDPQFKDAKFFVKASGDSMYPKIRHGDIIGCKPVDKDRFFAFYEIYLVVSKFNDQRLIKYIHPHQIDENKILLVSYYSAKIPPQPMPKDEIVAIYQVVGKVDYFAF